MDIQKPKKTTRKAKRLTIALVGAAAVLCLGAAVAPRVWSKLPAVDRASLSTDVVRQGDMVREVRAPGTLVPRDIFWLSSRMPAVVSKIEVLPGTSVEPDTVIMRLSNPEAEEGLRNAEAEVVAAEARLQARRAELRLSLLAQRSEMVRAQADYEASRVKAEASTKAVQMQVIPRVQYEQEQIALKQLQSRARIEHQRFDAFSSSIAAQLATVQADLEQQRSTLALRRSQIEALTVRAGTAGVLQFLSVQNGQQVQAGGALARVARPDILIARLRVPEMQAKDIQIGRSAEIDTYNGIVQGTVSRIDPAVVDGAVTVDVALPAVLPSGARPDLSIEGRIHIDTLKSVISVGRPAQAKERSSITMFRIDPSGDTATRVDVRIGAMSANRAQILSGLRIGDKVVLSDSSDWSRYDRIRLR